MHVRFKLHRNSAEIKQNVVKRHSQFAKKKKKLGGDWRFALAWNSYFNKKKTEYKNHMILYDDLGLKHDYSIVPSCV